MKTSQRRVAKPPTTRQPSFPRQPGLSQFECDLWRDVVVTVASRNGRINTDEAAGFADQAVLRYRTFAREIAKENDE